MGVTYRKWEEVKDHQRKRIVSYTEIGRFLKTKKYDKNPHLCHIFFMMCYLLVIYMGHFVIYSQKILTNFESRENNYGKRKKGQCNTKLVKYMSNKSL